MTAPQKLILSSMATGFESDQPPFLFNNDAFVELINAYVWRKRVLKKRGTKSLGQLRRDLTDQPLGNTDGSGVFTGNVISILTLQTNASIASGSISVVVGAQTFTEMTPLSGILTNGGSGSGTINYATGAIALATSPPLITTAALISFGYYPSLPSLGIEEYSANPVSNTPINFPDVVFFDQTYAYQYDFALRRFYDASFYKMPSAQNPITWHGANYQQFWSWSFQNAMFVTNNVPGFHFKVVTAITTAAAAQVTITAHGLKVNDVLFFNEVRGMSEINGLTGTVVSIVDDDNVTVSIDSTAFTAYTSDGIAQYLTSSIANNDGIRWYDGFGAGHGFVNFMPPLQQFDASLLPNPSYLVGARIIIPYQNQLLAIGTFESTSTGTFVYYPNRVRYSQLGTVFYTSNTPLNQTYEADSWIDNIPGKGGFVDLDTTEKILTADVSQEILVLGLERTGRKLIGTSNPLDPYTIQTINPEYGSESTYATIALDKGVLTVGDYGFILTTSFNAQRFDLLIPDQIYQIKNTNFGNERVCGIRDFRNEFVYFTYTAAKSSGDFPNRTLLFNLREKNFAIFYEEFTSYGNFRDSTTQTWASSKGTWAQTTQAWDSFRQYSRYPQIAGGNQQGYIQLKDQGTVNGLSHYIQALSGSSITSANHNRSVGDYIRVENCIGSTNLNETIVKVVSITNSNTFVIDKVATGTYKGLGEFSVIDNFSIKTKVFPFLWADGSACRLGVQLYLLQRTSLGECTVDIFTNQNSDDAQNDPEVATYLVGSNILRTRPDESLGLHDAQKQQDQIWHRLSNSFTGDSVQLGFRLSKNQVTDYNVVSSDFVLYSAVLAYYKSRVLA